MCVVIGLSCVHMWARGVGGGGGGGGSLFCISSIFELISVNTTVSFLLQEITTTPVLVARLLILIHIRRGSGNFVNTWAG